MDYLIPPITENKVNSALTLHCLGQNSICHILIPLSLKSLPPPLSWGEMEVWPAPLKGGRKPEFLSPSLGFLTALCDLATVSVDF